MRGGAVDGTGKLVSASNAKDTAEDWIARQRFPEDLKGRVVALVTFASEDDCRFFYPRRALNWQLQVNTYVSRRLRGTGARVSREALTPGDYFAWLGARADTADLRRDFADSRTGLQKPAAD